MPVTHGVAGSSPVRTAKKPDFGQAFFIYMTSLVHAGRNNSTVAFVFNNDFLPTQKQTAQLLCKYILINWLNHLSFPG